jgi:hypothetical protein
VDPSVLYLLVLAFGSAAILAIVLKLASSLLGAPRVFGRWAFCLPVGYAIAVALWSYLERTHLMGTGEGNLAGWVSMAFSAPMRAIATLLGVEPSLSYRVQVPVGLLASILLGIGLDLFWAMMYGRKGPVSK